MNIFVLSLNAREAAKMHLDKHVVKMILEYAQLLSTAHRILDEDVDERMYKLTHKNHPCTIWTRQSSSNYLFLYNLFCFLCEEYTYRYGKIHLTEKKLKDVLKKLPENIPEGTITTWAQAMPDEYKDKSVVQAYRNYYIGAKKDFAKWTKAPMPYWFKHSSRSIK